MMTTRVQKWGNCLAVRIPKPLVELAGLKRDAAVELAFVDGHLVVTPVEEQPEMRLAQMLKQVTEDNLHHEVDTGPAVGGEVW